jgi:hypothetical protein
MSEPGRPPPPPIPFSVLLGDRAFSGTYTVEGSPPIVKVVSPYGSKGTQQAGSPANEVAERLLYQIVMGIRRPGEPREGI